MNDRYIHPLQIGTVRLENNLALAPMAGFTNLAFRLIAKEVGGCGLVASEMVAALDAKNRLHDRRWRLLTETVPQEKPISMQVYGRDPARCAETAALLEEAGADLIDLNCGCPVRKAKQAGCGVALMDEPAQVGRIVGAMVAATTRPVTVKLRLAPRTADVARAAVGAGAAAVSVHARTGESKHGAPVDLAAVAEIRRAVDVPMLANGSLDTAERIRAARDIAGADGYQIGRAACGDPWLFRNLRAELAGEPAYEPSTAERCALLKRHYDLIVGLFGEEQGTRVMRKYAFFYCRGLPGVRAFRERFVRIERREDFERVVDEFFVSL